jgi:hypothetical protein
MSFTGISHLDLSIDKTNNWLADVAGELGTKDAGSRSGTGRPSTPTGSPARPASMPATWRRPPAG